MSLNKVIYSQLNSTFQTMLIMPEIERKDKIKRNQLLAKSRNYDKKQVYKYKEAIKVSDDTFDLI